MSSMVASALAIYNNLQSKDRQGFLTQSAPSIPSSPSTSQPADTQLTGDAMSAVRRAKKATNEKDTP